MAEEGSGGWVELRSAPGGRVLARGLVGRGPLTLRVECRLCNWCLERVFTPQELQAVLAMAVAPPAEEGARAAARLFQHIDEKHSDWP